MSLFTASSRWLISHIARKRATTYLVAALLVALTAAVPVGIRTAQAAGLNNSTTCPQFTLTPTQAPPQKSVYVCGSGFVASGSKNVEIQLYNQSTKQYQLIKYVTPTNGDVITHFTLPIDPGGQYYVQAYQRSSGILEQVPFNIIPGFQSLTPRKGSGVAPSDPLCIQDGLQSPPPPVNLQVWGLPPSSSYTVEWLNKKNNLINTEVASGNTTASGTFSTSFQVPPDPAGAYDLTVLTSAGPSPTATYNSGTLSCINWNEYGDGSLHFQWDGVGWDANSTVTFTFDGSPIWQASTSMSGSFAAGFQIPCPSPGTYSAAISGTADGQPQNWPISGGITVDSGCAPPPGSQGVRPTIKHSYWPGSTHD